MCEQPQPRILEVRANILRKNDEKARELRDEFTDAGCFVVSLVSSPGTGKTEFLKELLNELVKEYRVAAMVGDLRTDNDAERLSASGAPVKQIVTGTTCHLEADMVKEAMPWKADELDFLFIENVGNLVCPSGFDLGEDIRLVLVSTTEGEDKPAKYPTIFNTADIAVITKIDLADILEFDRDRMYESIEDVRPGMKSFEVSAKTGEGMQNFINFLKEERAKKPGKVIA